MDCFDKATSFKIFFSFSPEEQDIVICRHRCHVRSVHNQVSQHLENETYNLLGWQIWTVFWCLPPLMWAETFMESSPFNFPSSSVSTLPATTNWSPGSGKEKSSLSEEKERKIFPHLPLKRMWEFLSEILDWSTTLGSMYLKKINFASRSLPLKNWEV